MIILSFIGHSTLQAQTWTNLTTNDSYTVNAVAGSGALQQLLDDPDTQDGDVLQLTPQNGTFISTGLFNSDHNYAIVSKAVIIDGNGATVENDGFPSNTSAAIWFQADEIEEMKLMNITLCGFTHTNGSAVKNTYFKDSKIVYENVNVWNSANNSYAVWVEGDADITNCSFGNPLQTSNTGGLSINMWGDIGNTVNVVNSSFDCNRKDGNGSAIEIISKTTAGGHKLHTVNFTGGSISSNNANYAALYCNLGKDSQITFNGTEFDNNQGGNNEEGSPIYMSRASSPAQYLNLNDCLFRNNAGGSSKSHLIKAAISSDRVIANGCAFIEGSGTRAFLIELNSGANVTNCVFQGISFNDDGGNESGNTFTNSTNSGVMTDFWFQGVGPGSCTGGCIQPIGNSQGAQTSLDCEDNEPVLNSTMSGNWFYQLDGSAAVQFGTASTTAVIPEILRGEFVTFWQEVASGSNPVFAFTVAELPEINVLDVDPCFGSISGTIFQDGDGTAGSADGSAGAGEGMAGVIIHLLDASGMPVLDDLGNPITTTTDASGNYEFFNLPDSTYQIGVEVPTGVVGTTFENTGSPTTDSDVPLGTYTPGTMLISSTITIGGTDAPSNDDTFTGSRNIGSVGVGFVVDEIALPIVLSDFSVQQKDCQVQLLWKTETEINNEQFEIQRSMDGSSFKTIGSVKGSGTTLSSVQYTYDDLTARAGSSYYYRLKQVDFDGSFDFSKIVNQNVNCNSSNNVFSVYPTVLTEAQPINIESMEASKIVDISLVNINGQMIYSESNISFFDKNNISIDTKQMTSGIYILSIVDKNNKVESFKIIRQ